MFFALTNELLRSGYAIRFRTPGHSMHPTIRDSEIVTVEPVDPLDVRRGDVMLYQQAARLIAHRVVQVSEKRFIVRGDASRVCDGPVEASQVLGRVVHVERGGRRRKVSGGGLKRAMYRFVTQVESLRKQTKRIKPRTQRSGVWGWASGVWLD